MIQRNLFDIRRKYSRQSRRNGALTVADQMNLLRPLFFQESDRRQNIVNFASQIGAIEQMRAGCIQKIRPVGTEKIVLSDITFRRAAFADASDFQTKEVGFAVQLESQLLQFRRSAQMRDEQNRSRFGTELEALGRRELFQRNHDTGFRFNSETVQAEQRFNPLNLCPPDTVIGKRNLADLQYLPENCC